MPIRVVLVEDHQLMARGLKALLDDCDGISVVGIAATVADAVDLVGVARPDVVVMDYRLPDGSGADAARRLETVHRAPVLFLSADDSNDALLTAIEAGAVGYLLKSDPPELVVDAVRRAAEGEVVIPPDGMRRLLQLVRQRDRARASLDTLVTAITDRERETLALMADGCDNRTIAIELGVALTTARTHVRSLLQKLDAHSKLEAVAIARAAGLLEHDGRTDVRGRSRHRGG